MWNEMSYIRYSNRKNEREIDAFELEELRDIQNGCDNSECFYGIYEDITYKCTFGVEDLFRYCESEEF